MKSSWRRFFLAAAWLLAVTRSEAVSFTNIYQFNGPDGAVPYSGVVLSGNVLYGTTVQGGSNNVGTVFRVNLDGTDFTNLHQFNGNDGSSPQSDLILSGGTLYGTTLLGGGGSGTLFSLNTDGTGFTNFLVFQNVNGANPSFLSLSGNVLYGSTLSGAANAHGSIFRVNKDGSAFTNLVQFVYHSNVYGIIVTNNVIYGTTDRHSNLLVSTIFTMNTDGSGYNEIHDFSTAAVNPSGGLTNSDGINPNRLALSGNVLYGATQSGGTNGYGTLFKINSSGSGFSVLHTFLPTVNDAALNEFTNSGGISPGPLTSLTVSGNTLYGTTYSGGAFGIGTLFQINTDGTGFQTLRNFDGTGYRPVAALLLATNVLYGTLTDVDNGGFGNGNGSVFAFTLSPASAFLFIQPLSGAVKLTWTDPTFALQAAPFPNGIFTNIIGAASPYTNSLIGPQRFFRLQSN